MTLNCTITAEKYDQKSLQESISSILETNKLCSMATVDGENPYINTAYFAYTNELNIFILSQTTRQHSLNLVNNPAIALTVFDSGQPFASHLKGLQIFGKCILTKDLKAHKAFDIYTERFPKLLDLVPSFEDYERGIIQSRFYEITPSNIKIFDEPRFGKDVWITASICAKESLEV